MLEQVVDELRTAWPKRRIETQLAVTKTVSCDQARLAQLLSNLVANALTHGASEEPILVHASTVDGTFELSVSNQGEPIPPTTSALRDHARYQVEEREDGTGRGLRGRSRSYDRRVGSPQCARRRSGVVGHSRGSAREGHPRPVGWCGPEQGHTGDHGGDEHDYLPGTEGDRGQGRARTQSDETPADAE